MRASLLSQLQPGPDVLAMALSVSGFPGGSLRISNWAAVSTAHGLVKNGVPSMGYATRGAP
nr:hypothetical protein [Kibdelosporangium sp. MJ126-NF4]CTQ96527.1 hypothetical protein [Kibdelosporangium sp. MJ126-NF4]